MIKKILFKGHLSSQFVFATAGMLIGLTALLLSCQLILDVQSFHESEQELFGPNSIVIQKRVTKFTTLGANSTDFTPEDIESLRSKPFITDIAPFQSADFKVGISEVPGDGLPHFYADMFFQSVPDRFMDVKDVEWEWKDTTDIIPIVLPRDFIMIINYGIAQSQGMEQISEELMLAAKLKIHIEGQGKKVKQVGRVVGFSNKISSILVPEAYLSYMNTNYGNARITAPNRIFVTIVDDSYRELEDLMDEMNLDISKASIDVVKIKTVIAVVIGIFGLASALIMLLSLMGFVQYSQLVLSRAAYETKTLLRIGYSVSAVVKSFLSRLGLVFGVITGLAVLTMVLVKIYVVNIWLDDNGIHLEESGSSPTVVVGLITFLLFVLANYLNIRKTVTRLGKE